MWAERRIFSDAALQAEVWEMGFAVRPFMTAAKAQGYLAGVQKIASKLKIDFAPTMIGKAGIHISCAYHQTGYRNAVHDLARSMFEQRVLEFMDGYRLLTSVLFVKPPGGGQFDLHTDPAVLADFDRPAITAWCALDDVSQANGAMEFVPGSHSLFDFPSVSFAPQAFSPAFDTVSRLAVSVPMRAGEAVFFDHTCLHQSPTNSTGSARIALALVLIPENRRGIHFQIDNADPEQIRCHSFDSEERSKFSISEACSGTADLELLHSQPSNLQSFERDAALAILARGDQVRSGEIGLGTIVRSVKDGTNAVRRIQAYGEGVFNDREVAASFASSGFLKLPLITAKAARQLLEDVQKLAPDDNYDPDGRMGEQVSYHMTELDTNLAYKRRSRGLIEAVLQPSVDHLLKDYRILTTTLFVKPPGTGKIPLHTDWAVQEDQDWPTVYIWCPLEDVEEANGPLRVLPGSHGVLDFLHGPMMEAPYSVDDAYTLDRMQSVPLKAGEAIIFDASMLHWSPDNTTDKPRFAVRLACIPKHRRGVLFRQCPDDDAVIEMFSMETEEFHDHSGPELVSGAFKTRLLRKFIHSGSRVTGEEIEALIVDGDRIRSGEATMQAVLDAYRDARPAVAPDVAATPIARSIYRRAGSLAARVLRKAKVVAARPL